MKAYVTSVGERTTNLCLWSLQRQGFDTELVSGNSTLGEKLQYIYETADDDFVRVDADVIVAKRLDHIVTYPPFSENVWWVQFPVFDMYKLDLSNGGIQYIKKDALDALRRGIGEFLHDDRPETRMWNLDALKRPRRCQTYKYHVAGLHGFAQKDLDRVKTTKNNRKYADTYDFEMADKLQEFYS